MGQIPWNQSDPDLKAMEDALRPSRTIHWAPLSVGLLLVALATFVFAYYLPMYRAHQALLADQRRVEERVHSTEQALTKTQGELKTALTQTELLNALVQRSANNKAPSEGSANNEASDRLKSALSAKLEPWQKKAQVAVSASDGRIVVGLSDGLVFLAGKLDVSPQGRTALCEVAKASGSRALRVSAFADAKKPPPPLGLKYANGWALAAGAAANVAQLLSEKCGVAAPRLSATGLTGLKGGRSALESLKVSRTRVEIGIDESDVAR